MLKFLVAAAMSAAIVVAGAAVPSAAEAAQGIQVAQATQSKSSESKASKSKTAEKKLTPQQQKMKDCAGKWNARPDKTKVKGKDAYRKHMSGCLKS